MNTNTRKLRAAALAAMLLAATAAPCGATRWATVVSNSDYDDSAVWSPLPGAAQDGVTAADVLGRWGYAVTSATNRDSAEIGALVRAGQHGTASSSDVWMFEYSGHGQNSVLPATGALIGRSAAAGLGEYTSQALAADVYNAGASTQTRIVAIDACGSGRFIDKANDALKQLGVSGVFYSSTWTDECSWFYPDGGAFSRVFRKGLEGAADAMLGHPPDGRVTADEMDEYLGRFYNWQPPFPSARHGYISNGKGNTILADKAPIAMPSNSGPTWCNGAGLFNSGVHVTAGDTIVIGVEGSFWNGVAYATATGFRAYPDPRYGETLSMTCASNSLVGGVGTTTDQHIAAPLDGGGTDVYGPGFIGSYCRAVAPMTGDLYFGINDRPLNDNNGTLLLRIYVEHPSGGAQVAAVPTVNGVFVLDAPRPNPAHGAFRLAFALASAGDARLDVFDVGGRRVAARDLAAYGPGRHSVEFAASGGLGPGLYFARLSQGARSATTKIVVQ